MEIFVATNTHSVVYNFHSIKSSPDKNALLQAWIRKTYIHILHNK